jgi:hypothetical protein
MSKSPPFDYAQGGPKIANCAILEWGTLEFILLLAGIFVDGTAFHYEIHVL